MHTALYVILVDMILNSIRSVAGADDSSSQSAANATT